MVSPIPAPHEMKIDDGELSLASVAIATDPGTEHAADWLSSGLARFANIQQTEGGTPITLQIGNVNQQVPVTTGVRADGGSATDEAYQVEIAAKGVTVTGVSAEAVFRGATTVLQMAVLNGGTLPVGTIADAPRLAWRGLSFDVVRCFHPAATVRDVIDILALYKMNVLHWHLTDSEGWRFVVDSWPQLTEVSGKTARNDRPGGYYSTEEFADLVQYAADRYITVVPEFDSPGHTASVLRAYPELADQSIHDMDEAMRYLAPDRAGVPDLLADVYAAMAEQTTGAFIHIGGDEAIAMSHNVFQDYIQMALPLARKTGKRIVAWQEATRGGMSEGDLVQWWIPDSLVERFRAAASSDEGIRIAGFDPDSEVVKGFIALMMEAPNDVPRALEQGANIILSPSTQMYLDTKYPEASADAAQEERHERVGMPQQVYSNGTVEDSYNWDPVSIHPAVATNRIAGVEAAIWCETIEDKDDLFFQLLPRLSGVAEKAWSDHRDWDDYRPRLAAQPVFWDAMGLTWFKSSVVW